MNTGEHGAQVFLETMVLSDYFHKNLTLYPLIQSTGVITNCISEDSIWTRTWNKTSHEEAIPEALLSVGSYEILVSRDGENDCQYIFQLLFFTWTQDLRCRAQRQSLVTSSNSLGEAYRSYGHQSLLIFTMITHNYHTLIIYVLTWLTLRIIHPLRLGDLLFVFEIVSYLA
jgi:hypothetical protein